MKKRKVDVELHLTKAEIRKYCRHTMSSSYPEEASKVTDKLITKAVLYMEGYGDAMKYNIQEPVNHVELRNFLLDVAYEYILDHILD